MAAPDLFATRDISLRESEKSPSAFRTISETAELLDIPAHVLRFWESRFMQLKPVKSKGGRRYYRPEDIAMLSQIRHLLYERGYTIKGAQQMVGTQATEDATAALLPPDAIKFSHPQAVDNKTSLRRLKSELVQLRALLLAAVQQR